MPTDPPASDLLDAAPFPWGHPQAEPLREVLVQAYDGVPSDRIRQLVERAGLTRGEIRWAERPRDYWGEVLEAGAAQGCNDLLFSVILADPTCSAFHERLRRLIGWPAGTSVANEEDVPSALRPLLEAVRGDGAAATLDPTIVEPARRFTPRASTLTEYRLARVAHWKQPKYDQQIDPNFTRLTLILDRGEQAQGARWQDEDRRFDDLAALLEATSGDAPALVLIGEPGCGKTTLLSRLALQLAVAGLGGRCETDSDASSSADAAPSTSAAPPVPIVAFLSLAEFDPGLSPREFLATRWAERFAAMPPLEALLAGDAPVLLLLDALNEMPHADAAEFDAQVEAWKKDVQRLVSDRPGMRVLFSCRSLNYSGGLSSDELPVPHVRIEPLSDEQVRSYLAQHVPEAAGAVWARLEAAPKQLDLVRTPYYLQLLCEQVGPKGEFPAGRSALFTGFVRRALARELGRGTPGFAAGRLLDARDCKRLRSPLPWPSDHELPDGGPLLPRLEHLAFDMQQHGGATSRGQVTVTLEQAQDLLRRSASTLPGQPTDGDRDAAELDPILAGGAALGVLDIEELADRVRFAHQLIQEYFAARVLAAAPDPTLLRVPWRVGEVAESLEETKARIADSEPLPPLPATGWEESAVMAAEMMDADEAAAFTRDLAAADLPTAARCAAAPAVCVADDVADELRAALIARCEDETADLRARIAAGHALGRLGDPRFERRTGPHGAYLYPPLVEVPAGTYSIGADDISDDERPPHSVDLPAFAIGRFPITNAEYAHFVDAGGYEDERWWTTDHARAWLRGDPESVAATRASEKVFWESIPKDDEGFQQWLAVRTMTSEQAKLLDQYRQLSEERVNEFIADAIKAQVQTAPYFWHDAAYNRPAQPVVGVSLYEAQAYVRWLSAQTDRRFLLPSEVEWEGAARGRQGRDYPSGTDFDATCGNTFETHVRGTTPVGIFPKGATTSGIHDLSGNVWEWSRSLWGEVWARPTFGYPYATDDPAREDENAGPRLARVVRGGSWFLDRRSARASFRNWFDPVYRDFVVGFRVVLASPISR